MSLVSLLNQGLFYSSQGASSGGAASSSGSPVATAAPSAVPPSPSTSGSAAGLTQNGASTQGAAPDSGAWDDGADTTYTPAYVRSAANASPAASQTDDTTKAVARSGIANPLADTQKHFTDLLARLDASAQKTKEPSAANGAAAAPVPASDAASPAAARLKTVIAAYVADNMTGRTAAFSV